MSRRRTHGDPRALAQRVAVLVVDEERDLGAALQRAAQEHGMQAGRLDASVHTLREAVNDYRALFRPDQLQQLHAQRRLALQAMRSFDAFRPRLAGTLVHGDGRLDRIRLLLESDSPEPVIYRLSDLHIPWHEGDATLVFAGGQRATRPAFHFVAGDAQVELIVLRTADRSNPPRDVLGGGPLPTLDIDELQALLDAG